ncbi:MAG: CHAT domain-containing protein [Lutibacter sp.]|uniref:CHAT domain-containing protein n=1 Tax=Lutibacter sp. TaxID=1925666 RepID=UPI003859D8CF
MLNKKITLLFFIFSIIVAAQKTDERFKNRIKLLKQQDNYSEYIYVHLDEFAKNPSIENLSIFKSVQSNLWRVSSNKKESTALLYFYVNYAFQLKQFGFINQSILQYENAYAVYTKNHLSNYNIIEYCLKPLANNYTRLGDVDRAEDILKITIDKAQKKNKTNQLIAGYSNLAIVYRTKGAYTNAVTYLKLGLKLSNNSQIKSRLHSDLAINYLFLDNIEQAKKDIQLSIKLNIENEVSISTRNFITLGNCFFSEKQFDTALITFKKALKLAKIVFGKNNREVAKIYNQIAAVYKEQQQYKKALSTYQKSLSTLFPKYNPVSEFEDPLATYFYSENTIKEALDGRATIFIQLNNYEKALKNYDLAFKVEDKLRVTYLTQNAKLIQQQENRNRSENCIELCYEMYQKMNNSDWIEKGFQYAEQSKSVVLLEEKETSFLKSIIKKDSLFDVEESLNLKKTQLNKSIVIEELKGENASIKLLANFIEQRNEISNELQLLNQKIQLKYPILKVQKNSLITFKEIEAKLLLNNELFIEFFDGKRNIYVFSVSKGKPKNLEKIKKDDRFNLLVSEFLNLFSDSRGTDLQNNVPKYTTLGFKLFIKLFNFKLNKNTIIVPDGIFSFIPFDALITEETTITNFEKLPYLINEISISYAYSAAILLQKNKIIETKNDTFIGFFPVFEDNHRNLSELNYTLQEAKSIENTIDGNFLLKANASKSNFNKYAEDYSIIHLSTHASAGDFYVPPAIEFYNETLYLPEIYGYNLQTDLLVLSACETGLGTLRKGEGAMSLARGFSYAGVKNLLVSLWKVNDKSTEKLISDFYINYKKSGNKAGALHNSKLSYIDNKTISASKKSPYYWASFVYIGDVTSIDDKDFRFVWIFIVGIVLIMGYFLLKNVKFGRNT